MAATNIDLHDPRQVDMYQQREFLAATNIDLRAPEEPLVQTDEEYEKQLQKAIARSLRDIGLPPGDGDKEGEQQAGQLRHGPGQSSVATHVDHSVRRGEERRGEERGAGAETPHNSFTESSNAYRPEVPPGPAAPRARGSADAEPLGRSYERRAHRQSQERPNSSGKRGRS